MVPMASSLKGKLRGRGIIELLPRHDWHSSSPPSIIHSEFLSLSAITSAGLGVFPGGMTQTSFLRYRLRLELPPVSIHSYKEPGSTKRLQVDCLVPHVFFPPPCVTTALLPAKIVIPLLTLDTSNPKCFDIGCRL